MDEERTASRAGLRVRTHELEAVAYLYLTMAMHNHATRMSNEDIQRLGVDEYAERAVRAGLAESCKWGAGSGIQLTDSGHVLVYGAMQSVLRMTGDSLLSD